MARLREFNEDEVLEKAVELFWRKGYNGTSAQDMVDFLGISRSSLYATFGDKRSLFIKALLHYHHTNLQAILSLIDSSVEVEYTLNRLLEMVVSDSVSGKVSKGCFMVNSAVELAVHDKEIMTIVQQNRKDVEANLERVIERGQREGLFSNKNSAKSLASFLFNTILGLRVAAKAGGIKRMYDEVIKISLSVLKA